MTLQDAIKTCFTKYADFKGKASKSEYWWFSLFLVLVSLAASAISENLGGLFTLGTLLPSFAVGARRLHDTDKSGWWQLLVLVPVLGWIALIYLLAQEGKETTRY